MPHGLIRYVTQNYNQDGFPHLSREDSQEDALKTLQMSVAYLQHDLHDLQSLLYTYAL